MLAATALRILGLAMAKNSERASGPLDAFVGVRMPSDLRDALKLLASKQDRNLSNYIVHVLQQHVKGKGTAKR